jgi:hypothetical protein
MVKYYVLFVMFDRKAISRGLEDAASVTSEAVVEGLVDAAEDLEIEVEAGDSSADEAEEGKPVSLEPIAEGEEHPGGEDKSDDSEGHAESDEDVDGGDGQADVSDHGDSDHEPVDDKKAVPIRPRIEESEAEEKVLFEFPDTDVKIQYDR